LADMEGGSCADCCFHLSCTSGPMARNYFRTAYGISEMPGWSTCFACICPCCTATQMAGHVKKAGPPPTLPPKNASLSANYGGLPQNWRENVCLDPLNLCCTTMMVSCESASHAASVTGLPMWVPLCCSNYYTNHHIMRTNYGVPGNALWNDCLEPFLYMQVCSYIPGCFVCTCFYVGQQMENERLLMEKEKTMGLPKLMANSQVVATTVAFVGGPAAPDSASLNEHPQLQQQGYHHHHHHHRRFSEWPVTARVLSRAAPHFANRLASRAPTTSVITAQPL